SIPPIYLLDAVLEAGLIGLWVYSWRTGNILFVREPVVTAQTASEGAAAPPPPAPAQPRRPPGQARPGPQQTPHATPGGETRAGRTRRCRSDKGCCQRR